MDKSIIPQGGDNPVKPTRSSNLMITNEKVGTGGGGVSGVARPTGKPPSPNIVRTRGLPRVLPAHQLSHRIAGVLDVLQVLSFNAQSVAFFIGITCEDDVTSDTCSLPQLSKNLAA